MSIDYLLQIDDIKGESSTVGFEGAIPVVAWSWGVSQTGAVGSGSGRGAGKAEFDELQVVAVLGSASPELAKSCATGRHHREVSLVGVKVGDGNPQEFVRYELADALVSSVEHSAAADDRPTEEVAFTYRELSLTSTEQRADGSAGAQTTFSSDVAGNQSRG